MLPACVPKEYGLKPNGSPYGCLGPFGTVRQNHCFCHAQAAKPVLFFICVCFRMMVGDVWRFVIALSLPPETILGTLSSCVDLIMSPSNVVIPIMVENP